MIWPEMASHVTALFRKFDALVQWRVRAGLCPDATFSGIGFRVHTAWMEFQGCGRNFFALAAFILLRRNAGITKLPAGAAADERMQDREFQQPAESGNELLEDIL